MKEVVDLAVGVGLGNPHSLYSAFQPKDFAANEAGREVGKNIAKNSCFDPTDSNLKKIYERCKEGCNDKGFKPQRSFPASPLHGYRNYIPSYRVGHALGAYPEEGSDYRTW
jgi:hypothetical protein